VGIFWSTGGDHVCIQIYTTCCCCPRCTTKVRSGGVRWVQVHEPGSQAKKATCITIQIKVTAFSTAHEYSWHCNHLLVPQTSLRAMWPWCIRNILVASAILWLFALGNGNYHKKGRIPEVRTYLVLEPTGFRAVMNMSLSSKCITPSLAGRSLAICWQPSSSSSSEKLENVLQNLCFTMACHRFSPI